MDKTFMRAALAMGRRHQGSTWPNPSVGCVLVQHQHIIAAAVTAPGGRPHAETQALAMAGDAARGAAAYVTLEPCAHVGRTPPCSEALIAAGVARVVIAAADPDPRVNGAGAARLRAAGIEVVEGVLAGEAAASLAGFLTRIRLGRPLVTLKLATTLDGRIATGSGESRWITGPAARREVHGMRGRHDATMVGIGTALADNPDLACRLRGYRPTPNLRIVVDSHLRLKLTARLVLTATEAPVWVLHHDAADPVRVAALTRAGVRCLGVTAGEGGSLDCAAALAMLGSEGVTSVLLEGGATLAAAFLRADLVDRLAWFHAAAILGGDATPAIQAMAAGGLAEMARFTRVAIRPVGPDVLSEFERTAQGRP